MLIFSDRGIYCPQGNFYLDPWKPVDHAIITHAHSDHARWGSKHYLAHKDSVPLLRLRLGEGSYQSANWNEPIMINGVQVSLHPAGHIIGSSQVRVEYKGEVWVFSGDYKTTNDGISGSFVPIRCNTFITESTFALPIYRWKAQETVYEEMRQWINRNKAQGRSSVFMAYSLGKAQRVIDAVHQISEDIYVHGAIWNTHETLLNAGFRLPQVKRILPDTPKQLLKGAVVIAPPSAEGSSWMQRFAPYAVGICSGWMQVRGNARRRNADAGFALSDHADWDGLLSAIDATGASKVFVTHGFQSVLSRYLNEKGIAAAEVKTAYGEDEENTVAATGEEKKEDGVDENIPVIHDVLNNAVKDDGNIIAQENE
jgi:putative mRNA 3-end processing factor